VLKQGKIYWFKSDVVTPVSHSWRGTHQQQQQQHTPPVVLTTATLLLLLAC
jgi:hypothetical protein